MEPHPLGRYFTVEPGSPIPGHVIVRARPPVVQLDHMPAEALTALGPLLAALMKAIVGVVQAERVYVLRFGEEVEAIHFHLFPRTRLMADRYRAQHPELKGVSGAQMFDWARRPEVAPFLVSAIDAVQAFAAIVRTVP